MVHIDDQGGGRSAVSADPLLGLRLHILVVGKQRHGCGGLLACIGGGMKSKKIAWRREDARAAPNIVMPFATEEGDVAGIVQGLRDLAYMLECSHIQYISGGVSAIPTHTARGE